LEAVLAEPDVRSADLIVLTGDHAAGPLPVPTLDLLSRLDNTVWVRGNADRELAALARGAGSSAIPDPIAPWAAAQLRPDQVKLLESLPLIVTVDVAGFGPVLFCHATPRDDEEVVLVDSRLSRWDEVFAGVPESTVVCGHTHMPYVRLVDRRLVVNPGSVGMPYGAAGGHWALLADGAVSLRRTGYDYDAACSRIEAESGYQDAAEWADEYVRSRNSDAEALRVFGPRDGRSGPLPTDS
jgi:predicted phosphodiesterase